MVTIFFIHTDTSEFRGMARVFRIFDLFFQKNLLAAQKILSKWGLYSDLEEVRKSI